MDTTLYNTLLRQIAVMQTTRKKPHTLRIDIDSADALARELGGSVLIIKGQRIAGLEIEITSEPSFDVVDADTLEREEVREILKTVQSQYPSLTLDELERLFHETYEQEVRTIEASLN